MENILKALKIFDGGITETAKRVDKAPHSVTRALKGEWDAPEIVDAAKEVITEKLAKVQDLLSKDNVISEAA